MLIKIENGNIKPKDSILGVSKKGKNPKFEDLKIWKFVFFESYFLLGASKVSVWSLEKKFRSLDNL